MPNKFDQVSNEKFLNSDGVIHLWEIIRARFDRKLDRIEPNDNSVVVEDNDRIGVKISQRSGNSIVVVDDQGEEGLFVPPSATTGTYMITRLGTATDGSLASYKLQRRIIDDGDAQDITGSDVIDIPDSFAVTGGSVETKSVQGDWGEAGTYIHLTMQNSQDSMDVYINVDELVTETDPTVPEWAKQPTKPTYTAQEIGAITEPRSEGMSGQVLTTDGNGGRSWTTVRSGDGGTFDYDELNNKPQIGGVTLSGNKSLSDLGIASTADVDEKYTKPAGGIPDQDLAPSIQYSLALLDSAYQRPPTGIPAYDMTYEVQTSLEKADLAYQKPSGGIPAEDIAPGVIPDISGKVNEPSSEGTVGQALVTDGQGGRWWATVVPSGGFAGDILTKGSGGDFDIGWVTPASSVDQDNTRPITAAAVYTEIGNINALLATI